MFPQRMPIKWEKSWLNNFIKNVKIVEGFSFIPSIDLIWITLTDKRYYDFQFSWLKWYFTIGQIHKKLKECNY